MKENAMLDAIYDLLADNNPLSCRQIAGLMGVDAAIIKDELACMIDCGTVVKYGRHRYKVKGKAVSQQKALRFPCQYSTTELMAVLKQLVGNHVDEFGVPDAIRSAAETLLVAGDTSSRQSIIVRSALADLRSKGLLNYTNQPAQPAQHSLTSADLVSLVRRLRDEATKALNYRGAMMEPELASAIEDARDFEMKLSEVLEGQMVSYFFPEL